MTIKTPETDEQRRGDGAKRQKQGGHYAPDDNVQIVIDQKNGRILINDGTDDRVVIGNLDF